MIIVGLFVLFLYNVCKTIHINPLFFEYVKETNNYALFVFPMSHIFLYDKDDKKIGFVSKICNKIFVAVYIIKNKRKQGYIQKYMETYNGYVITNNKNIVNYLERHEFTTIVNIPFFRFFYRPNNKFI